MFNSEVLASNITAFRKAKGISQQALAAALSISPQSVSKWECGASVPDIENLCANGNCDLGKLCGRYCYGCFDIACSFVWRNPAKEYGND